MPRLQIEIVLPYFLRLRENAYPTSSKGDGEPIQVKQPPLLEGTKLLTAIQADFDYDPTVTNLDEIDESRHRFGNQLLRRTNQLLRWYRATSGQPEIIELTRTRCSPFTFSVPDDSASPAWSEPLVFEAEGPSGPRLSLDDQTTRVRDGLSSGHDPAVADLCLLDARRSLHEGRFREAVLFCWSTIDATFNQKYEALVEEKLAGEWNSAREFFTGVDFGLRNKMTAALFLVAGRSLFRDSASDWNELTASYRKRNGIIHSGENATEEDAELALRVARRVVAAMATL